VRWCSKGDAASIWIGIIDGLVKLVSLAKAPPAINNVALPAMGARFGICPAPWSKRTGSDGAR